MLLSKEIARRWRHPRIHGLRRPSMADPQRADVAAAAAPVTTAPPTLPEPDATSHTTPMGIRTPDQRLRVFVSSTLEELADERRVARAASSALRLNPVLFELTARPHPPRELYRA